MNPGKPISGSPAVQGFKEQQADLIK